MSFSFIGAYEEEIVKTNPLREKKEITSWYASGLGTCPTGRYLERIGVPPDTEFDERTLDVFAVGKSEEAFFLETLKNSELLDFQEQVRIEDKKLGVSGYADAVAVVKESGKPIVLEIKSKHSRAFWYMHKKKEGAQMHHRMQLWIYLYCLDIEEGRIVYISKDDRCKLEFPIYLNDPELKKLVMSELKMMQRAWKEKLPPPVLFDETDWRAKYCRWHKQCTCQKEYLTL